MNNLHKFSCCMIPGLYDYDNAYMDSGKAFDKAGADIQKYGKLNPDKTCAVNGRTQGSVVEQSDLAVQVQVP